MSKRVNLVFAGLVALAAWLPGLNAYAATSGTITNTATISWETGQNRVSISSNTVEVQVKRVRPPGSTTFTAFQLAGQGNAGQSMPVPQTMCRASSGDVPVKLEGAFSTTRLDPASLNPATAIRAGEPLIIQVDSPSDNVDPSRADSFSIRITTPAGDAEQLTLQETGANTGRFAGLIRTAAIPPQPVAGDCLLSVRPGDSINLNGTATADNVPVGSSVVDILVDPFGIVFDSDDGAPIPGSRVTLVDAATGIPADVFGDDGVSRYPNSVITGETVTDSGGTVYTFPPGDYRFPFARPGNYRLVVEVPNPYSVPSKATPEELANLRRPDGLPYTIIPGSYSQPFTLLDPAPVRIDIPADKPGGSLTLSKAASTDRAAPGDAVQYKLQIANPSGTRTTGAVTITDSLPIAMRYRKDSARLNGQKVAHSVSADGRTLSITIPSMQPGQNGVVTYLLEVRPDARPGSTLNRAQASDTRGATSRVADASVRIERDAISERLTIIGRITDGGCTVDDKAANGVPGVRVMLEDGSYAVTDIEGRYHFEGVMPGLHVVQIDPSSLPAGQEPADCVRNARSGGSAISRFVEGQGGALLRADFRTKAGVNAYRPDGEKAGRTSPVSDQEAAGTGRNWLQDGRTGIEWLFPEADHNPRTKAVRIAIRHAPNQSIKLFANGVPVNELNFDGVTKNPQKTAAVSLWRGVELADGTTNFKAEVRGANGEIVETLNRNVHYATTAVRADLVREKSNLVADGVSRPVIALRMTDRNGRPIHHGVTGDFSVPAPYYPAVEADAQAARNLSGLERARPVWRVEGDDGIAYVELEPTTASGALTITLPFREQDVSRVQRVETWLTPGERPWTIVGFAAGSAGFNTLEGRMEELADAKKDKVTDGRIAFYAKGRIKGQWLMTLAYDSDKKADESRFGGVIDPNEYYTIYADRSERRYDAASVRKLYVRLERPQFYALFGDYETAINEPQLTRYNRSFNGLKAEFRNDKILANAFAADTPFRHRRQEIQGNGLTGPYALGSRDIMANSERVVIETRDRLRSNQIIDTRTMTRHIDYDIDYAAGTLRFREPVLSRSSGLDPQFIVVDYEVDGVAQRVTNAGGRVRWTNDSKTLAIGATALHDESDTSRTNMGGVDVRFTPDQKTEIRAEFAASDSKSSGGGTAPAKNSATAWLVEAEHHGDKVDLLAYAREQQSGYGVGQQNSAESGARKIGVDGRLRVTPKLSLTGSAWHETALDTSARRQAGRLLAEYRGEGFDSRAGLTLANDRLDDGSTVSSTIAQFGASKRLFNNKLELDGQTEIPLDQRGGSIDFPARHRLSARWSFSDAISLIGSYELADGKAIDARTARIGFDLKPWAGGRFTASANAQNFDEYGPRTYAAYGLAQSLPVGKKLTLDFTLDGNKTLGGVDPARVLEPAHPVASGGFLGNEGTLTEDFTAVTAGASWRSENWSIASRAEYRTGEDSNRYGLTLSGLRQIGEGRAFGGALSWFRAKQDGGPETEAATIALSWAHRPDDSRFAFLEKLELKSDLVRNAVAGAPGPIGGAPLLISGNAKSQRIINSLSVNWSPSGFVDNEYLARSEVSLFWGSRYTFDRIDADDLKGWSNIVGLDARYDLSSKIDLGIAGTVRQNPGGRSYAFSGGPTIGVSPIENSYITIGYNVLGFRDKDFERSRYTRSGPFITFRLKFDQESLGFLGINPNGN